MSEIPSFWAGAQRYGAGVDLGALAAHAGGWDAAEEAGESLLVAHGVTAERAARWVRSRPGRTRGVALLRRDPAYPTRLAELPGAPAVLCVDGDPKALAGPALAIVGTRACTAYGDSTARALATALAAAGVSVISGLARGIDAAAHSGAVGHGRTVAIVAHGLDHTAPLANRRLRDAIVANRGAIASPYADDVEPRPWRFPARNPIISGLSDGVVVVEAPRRSGALLTATAAAEQGREVWAVPGPIGAPASVGCLELIASGAGVIVAIDAFVAEQTGRGRASRDAWLERLLAGATVDEVARAEGSPVAEIIARIARLELTGALVRSGGQRYALVRSD